MLAIRCQYEFSCRKHQFLTIKLLFMKKTFMYKSTWIKAIKFMMFATFLLLNTSLFAQQAVRGKITDEKGNPLPGATVSVKGTNQQTVADGQGNFSINVPSSSILIISNVGFLMKEVKLHNKTDVTIALSEVSSELNQVIITGVYDKRKRIDASVAISTISGEQIKAQMPVSAADLLKNIPSVHVNSAMGEIRNQVLVRGTPMSSDPGIGYFYVSMQEDGLPVTNLTGYNFGPDYYLRADATISRVEAVRGGSASITGSDAPGGLFNYVSLKLAVVNLLVTCG